ncbi:monooxygenase [Dactylosporangium sp. AC04546]|uniref:monooxygenase n=1 Tax=Dactylosporangium sp. AC04546 TaxID=2862460 RepID=UPI001EDE6D8B|nr:monooxygenase [Dactylosporangium sp. AC04546]WVK82153.1 monooxygenase [Dactylosporangium sp. AC04546]
MTVRLFVWRVRPAAVPLAFWSMAVDRRPLSRSAAFAKLLGTGRGSEFGVGAADLTRWAAVVVDGPEPPMRGAVQRTVLTLEPIASRGTWSGQEPFRNAGEQREGPIAVLTRARLRPARAVQFWRAVDPVSRSLRQADGLLCALGVGEAPVGFQGTVSVWRSAADIVRFAYRQPEHAEVVERTVRLGWYAEELFARFRVLGVDGDREVLGWRDGP